MTRRFRRALFYFLILVFLAAGSALVLYAQGRRLDLRTGRLTEVGGIYIRSLPSNANIFLDGEPVRNRSGFFQSGTLITDLFPQPYRLRLELDGYHPLERTVAVEPAMVVALESALLVPKDARTVLQGPVREFWLLSDILARDTDGKLNLQNRELPGSSVLGWTEDGNQVLTGDQAGNMFWSDIRTSTSTPLAPLLRRLNLRISTSTAVFPDPFNSSNLILEQPDLLALLNRDRGQFLAIASSTATSSISRTAVSSAALAWTSYSGKEKTSELTIYDKFFGNKRVISRPLPGRTVKAKWRENVLGLQQDGGEFYLYRNGDDSWTSVASDVRDFEFGPNGDRVALRNGEGLEIIDFRNEKEYRRFKLPDAGKIRGLIWLEDGEHLLLPYPDRTFFLDLDDLGLENFFPITPTSNIAYDPGSNRLYYLMDEKIFSLDLPRR